MGIDVFHKCHQERIKMFPASLGTFFYALLVSGFPSQRGNVEMSCYSITNYFILTLLKHGCLSLFLSQVGL